jgi:hypothetical protein
MMTKPALSPLRSGDVVRITVGPHRRRLAIVIAVRDDGRLSAHLIDSGLRIEVAASEARGARDRLRS